MTTSRPRRSDVLAAATTIERRPRFLACMLPLRPAQPTGAVHPIKARPTVHRYALRLALFTCLLAFPASPVAADGAGGERARSAAPAGPPGAPTALSATADGYSGINLSWTRPSSDGGKAIEGYRIEYRRRVVPYQTATGWETWSGWEVLVANTDTTTTTYRHGLAAGTTRRYRVFAINADGRGPASNTADASTDAPEIRISNFTASVKEGETVSYTVSRSSGATSHLMEGVLWVGPSGGVYNARELGGLGTRVNNRWYETYPVRFEKGNATATVKLKTNGNNVIGTGGDIHVFLASQAYFSVSYEDGTPGGRGEPVTLVKGSPSEAMATVEDNETAVWKLSLSPESTVEADAETVRATFSIVNGKTFAKDGTIGLTFDGTATKGTDYTASANIALPAGAGSAGFDIQIVNNTEAESEETVVVRSLISIEDGLRPLVMLDRTGDLVEATLTIRDGNSAGAPDKVRGLRAKARGARAITLKWDRPAANGGTITGYKIGISTDGSDTWNDPQSLPDLESWVDQGLTASTQRHYRVRAVSTHGDGPWSDTVSATTSWQAVWLEGVNTAREGDELTFTVKREPKATSNAFMYVVLRVTDTGGVLAGTTGLTDSDDGTKLLVMTGLTEADFKVRTRANGTPQGGTVTVAIQEGYFYDLDTPTSITVDVANLESINQDSGPSLSVADAEATEGEDAAMDFVVTLDSASAEVVTVDYATQDGSAEAPDDYTATNGKLTFAAGDTALTISVPVADDNEEDDGETFTLTLSNPTGATLADSTATGTIHNTEVVPSRLSVADAEASEGAGNTLDFVVTLDPAASGTVTVDYATSDGTATADADYAEASGTLTFSPGDTVQTVSVVTTDDSADEEDETFTLTLSSPTNATLADSTATGTINDADEIPAVSVSDASANEGDSVEFTVSLSAASALQVTVAYATSGGTATTGDDFTEESGTLTFAANETSKTVSVATADDSADEDEDDETFTLTLSNPTNATLADSTATGTIIELRDRPYDLQATAAGGVVTLTWQDPETHASHGFYTILRRRPELGEAELLAYAEYVESSNRTFADSAVQAGVLYEYAVRAVKDALGYLGPPSNPVQVRMSGTYAEPTLSVADASATEGEAVEFTVSLSAASSRQVTVQYETSGGTATSGTDFTEESGTLTFAANETSKTVSVATTDDSADEDDETFTLTLSSPTNATLAAATANGTINDDDEMPALSVSDASATEGEAVEFTVSLSAASALQVTVEYETSGGTATTGDDFTEESGTLTFAAHETSQTVSVATTDDSADEENETFTLTLSSPANATLGTATATGTINDNDESLAPLTASFSGMPDSHTGAEFTFALTFSEEPDPDLSYETLRDDAFDVTGGGVEKARRQQQGSNLAWEITVDPSGQGDVTITLPATTTACTASGAICTEDGRKLSNSESRTVTGPVVVPSVSVADASATEGDAVEFTVSLSPASSQQVTVQYATSGGTATSGTDFTADSGTLTFAANETSQTVSVATTDDSADESDETFTLTLSSPTGATLGTATATGTIVDDDEALAPLTASFSDMPDSHTGTAFTFGLTFSEEPDLSYLTLRDHAFDVTGGEVRKARRQQQGSNLAWTITVKPTSANDTVTIELPATTSNCTSTDAICTDDGRKLSNSESDTVVPAASSSAGDQTQGGNVNEEIDMVRALSILDGVTPDEAIRALFGELTLSPAQLDALDRLGNRNGRYDLGDVLSWQDRCRRGGALCGKTSTASGPASAAALLSSAALGHRGRRKRPRGRESVRDGRSPVRGKRRRVRTVACALVMLLTAATAWSCTDGSVGPTAPAAGVADPGFLTVAWTGPPAARDIAVLLELEGPSIETVRAPGLKLYQSSGPGPRRIIVMGSLRAGPLLQLRVADRGRIPEYRVRVLEVTTEDYGLRDVDEYRAVVTN